MEAKPVNGEYEKIRGPHREFLRLPSTAVEWFIIAVLILMVAVLFLPDVDMTKTEVEKAVKKSATTAKP